MLDELDRFEARVAPNEPGEDSCVVVPFDPFERSFRDGDVNQVVRSWLEWDRLRDLIADGTASIELHRSWSGRLMAEFAVYSAWYVDASGDFCEYRDDGARPIKLNTIDEYFDVLPGASRDAVESIAHQLESRPNLALPTLEIVTIKVGERALFVLDGNHRVATFAHKRSRRPPVSAIVAEYRIRVDELDEDVLPDLQHFIGARPADG